MTHVVHIHPIIRNQGGGARNRKKSPIIPLSSGIPLLILILIKQIITAANIYYALCARHYYSLIRPSRQPSEGMIWTLRFIIPVLRLGSRQPYEIDGCYVYPHVQMRKLRQQSKKLLRDTKPGMQGWDSNVGSVALLSGTALNHYATSPPQGPGGPGVRETHNKQDIICCPNWPK